MIKQLTTAAMLAIIALALVARLYFLSVSGGYETDQVAWANQFFFGGLTQVYLAMRDALISGHAEPKMWPYLPGYPAFLAALKLAGVDDLRWVRIVQTA